jgi:hypothetical protein
LIEIGVGVFLKHSAVRFPDICWDGVRGAQRIGSGLKRLVAAPSQMNGERNREKKAEFQPRHRMPLSRRSDTVTFRCKMGEKFRNLSFTPLEIVT